MASLSKTLLIGNVGNDVELKYTASGDAICNLSIATSDTWKDKATGEQREATEWHRVVLYRKLAEIAGKYLKKGSQVYIEGQNKTRKWTDKNGVEKYTTEVQASELKMLGGKGQPEQKPQSQQSDIDVPF